MYQILHLLCAGDSQVLGIDVQLLEHIHKQKYSARWDQRKTDSSFISNDTFSGEWLIPSLKGLLSLQIISDIGIIAVY